MQRHGTYARRVDVAPGVGVSPDGRKLAFVALSADSKLRLWIRSVDSLDSRLLVDAETAAANVPFFWSSDSRFLAFLSSDHKLKKVDVAGGPAQTLCDAADLVGGSWSRDGVILFAAGVWLEFQAAWP